MSITMSSSMEYHKVSFGTFKALKFMLLYMYNNKKLRFAKKYPSCHKRK